MKIHELMSSYCSIAGDSCKSLPIEYVVCSISVLIVLILCIIFFLIFCNCDIIENHFSENNHDVKINIIAHENLYFMKIAQCMTFHGFLVSEKFPKFHSEVSTKLYPTVNCVTLHVQLGASKFNFLEGISPLL